jgi:tripartite-type tricarboxylate transporter receptor subunit TctC
MAHRRLIGAPLSLLLAAPAAAPAQDGPAKPVKFVVPFPPCSPRRTFSRDSRRQSRA